MGDQRRASLFGVAQQRQHQPVAVEDAGRFGVQAGDRAYRRFELANLGGGQRLQRYAVGGRPPLVASQRGQLRLVGGDQQLADPAMGDAALGAVPIEPFLAPTHKRALSEPVG